MRNKMLDLFKRSIPLITCALLLNGCAVFEKQAFGKDRKGKKDAKPIELKETGRVSKDGAIELEPIIIKVEKDTVPRAQIRFLP